MLDVLGFKVEGGGASFRPLSSQEREGCPSLATCAQGMARQLPLRPYPSLPLALSHSPTPRSS